MAGSISISATRNSSSPRPFQQQAPTPAQLSGDSIEKGGFDAAVDAYLSKAHRDARTPICPFAAVGSDVARAGSETKAAAVDVLEQLLETLVDGEMTPETRGSAIAAYLTMIGAMVLARVASGTPLSNEILDSARDHLRCSAIRQDAG